MAEINTLQAMKNYVLRKLGAPVLNIEIEDSQLEQEIEDGIQDAQRYLYGDATFMDYLIFTTSAGISEYPVSGIRDMTTGAQLDNVESIYDFTVSFGMDGINTLFSPTHILLYNQYVEQGSYPGGPGMGGAGMVLADYDISMMYLDMIDEKFGKMYTCRYLQGRKIIQVIPTPDTSLFGVLQFYRKEYAQNLYNHPLVKKLCVARAGIRWGRNVNKYGGTMPDGMTINGAEIITEYKEQEEKIMELLGPGGESEVPGIWVA